MGGIVNLKISYLTGAKVKVAILKVTGAGGAYPL